MTFKTIFHPDKKNLQRKPNTDGWGNKLVTIFALHLDNFILKQYFQSTYLNRDIGSGQILPPRQLYLSPGFAKIAPYPPCTVTTSRLKNQDSAQCLRRVTQLPFIAGPSDCLKTYLYLLITNNITYI